MRAGDFRWECPLCRESVIVPVTVDGPGPAVDGTIGDKIGTARFHADVEPVKEHCELHHAEGRAVPGYSVPVSAEA